MESATDVKRWSAWGAVVGPIQFTVTWLVLGFVSEGYALWDDWIDYSPVGQPISGLGMGATAWTMNVSFVALGVLLIVGARGICAAIPDLTPRARRACAVLLGTVGVGAILDGLFNLESILLHSLGFFLVISTVIGFPIVGRLLLKVPEWRSLGRGLVFAGPITLVLSVGYFASFDPIAAGRGEGVAGLTQRVLVTWIFAWYVVLGWRAARSDVRVNPESQPVAGSTGR